MEFPTYVYRRKANSPWRYRGVGYVVHPVNDAAEYAAALASGHVATHDELCAPVKAAAPAPELPSTDGPVTRAELVQEARRLGIKFGPNTSDKKLLAAINAAHGEG